MADEKHEALLLNRNSDISPDHTAWIKEQFSKRRFISARGREVWIKAPGRNLSRIVNIPSRDSANYKKAWVDVYNLCLDYLEGMVNSACLENKFIQRMGNVWMLNGHVVIWPKFNRANADYARGLERILEEYIYVKTKYIESLNKSEGLRIKKSSVSLTPREVPKVSNVKPLMPKQQITRPVVKKEIEVPKRAISNVEKINATQRLTTEEKTVAPQVLPKKIAQPKPVEPKPEKPKRIIKKVPSVKENITNSKSLKIHKISDGDTLNSRDYSKLREDNTDILILTCMNVLNTKEEDIFLKNARNSLKEGMKTGAFIYGHAKDEHEGASELKILLKILSKFSRDFSGLIFYSIDNEYVRQIREDEEKILDYINVYNAVITTLKRAGYTTLISMNLESGKIISKIMKQYSMESEHTIIYMVVVRDVEELGNSTPRIVVDPWNDFDTVELNNKDLENLLRNKIM